MSMKGDSEKDRVLTEARSMVVRDYLIKNFKLDDIRIKTLGMGKTNVPEDNGKIEILVYGGGANPPAPSQSTVSGAPRAR